MTLPTMTQAISAVQVMESRLQRDQKIAVHCHAGLGRTGLLVACLLVLARRYAPLDAVTMIRLKRPGSIQTAAQLEFVSQFEEHVRGLRVQFGPAPTGTPWTLAEYMQLQRTLLHGDERRTLFKTPKILVKLTQSLSDQAPVTTRESLGVSLIRMTSAATMEENSSPRSMPSIESLVLDEPARSFSDQVVLEDDHFTATCNALQLGDWSMLAQISDPWLVLCIGLSWLERLSEPVVPAAAANAMADPQEKRAPVEILRDLDPSSFALGAFTAMATLCRVVIRASRHQRASDGRWSEPVFRRSASALLHRPRNIEGPWTSILRSLSATPQSTVELEDNVVDAVVESLKEASNDPSWNSPRKTRAVSRVSDSDDNGD
jgi:Protein-tyrosine phosphatase